MTTKRGTRAAATEEPKPETVNPPEIVIEPEPTMTIQNDSIVMTGAPVAEVVNDGVREIKPFSWGNDGWTTDFSPRAVSADAEVEPVTGRFAADVVQFEEEGEGDVEEADPKDSSAQGSAESSDSLTPDSQDPF